MQTNYYKRQKTVAKYSGITLFFIMVLALVFAFTNANVSNMIKSEADNNSYQLVLSSANSRSSAGDVVQRSQTGGNVTFTYSNVSAPSSGYHTRLNNGGSVVNKDLIHSLDKFTAVFDGAGTLKGRIAYTTNSWGEYFTLVSGQEVEFGTLPYYLELKADGGIVNLKSATYKYTCQVNSDAESHVDQGTFDITFKTNSSDSGTDISSASSSIMAEVTSGSNYISSFSDASKIYAGTNGLKFGSSKATGSITINFNTTNVNKKITTIILDTAQYSTDTGKFHAYINGSNSYSEITPSAGGSIEVNANLTTLTLETTTKRAYLSGISLNYNESTEPGTPDTPIYITGFGADDTNKNSYTTNSIFANENALSVYTINSLGQQSSVGSNEYSYVIKNAYDETINPLEKFPATGIYTLTVSYGNYIPVEISLNVAEYVYLTDITAALTKTTYNTGETFAANLSNNILTATAEFSDGSTGQQIAYENFAENHIGVKLLTPKGISYDFDKPLGTAGTWTVKVYSLDDENIHYSISITVNAIPVASISLDHSSETLYPEGTLQLVATVNPNNATNSSIVWSSNNEDVATVDENGLVTAVAVGGATITATAEDGSNVYGSCAITVIAKPSTTDYDIDATTTTQVTTNTTSSVVFTNSPVTVTISKSSSSTNANNYVASGTNKHTRAYSGQTFRISISDGSMSKIVIHGTSDKGVVGFTSPTWTNASKASSGNEVTLTPTNGSNDVYCTVSGTVSFSGVTVTCGGGSSSTPIYPTSIVLSASSSSISIGNTSTLTVTYTPTDTNVKNVTFTSSNESVATVSNTGIVTGVAQGSATITATAEGANSGTVTATTTITVTPIAVTSVSLSSNSETIKVGKTVTLVPTVSPATATNKSVTWTSSDTSVATVSSAGVVTGVAAGQSTITVKTVDGNKTATCVVTVKADTAGGEETFTITYSDLPSTYQTGSTVYTADSGIKFQAYNCANYSSKMQFKASSGYLQTTEALELQSLTINDRESNTLTVYGSNTAGSFSTTITGTNDTYDLSGYSYFKIARTASGAGYCSSLTIVTGTPEPTDPTSIILSPSSVELAPGGTKDMSVSYVPSNANQNKDITWTSSNTNVATVDSTGKITAKSTATVGQSTTITARLTNISSIFATCTVTIIEQSKDDHTVLIYMCGADLESDNQLATGDIQEILKVSGQPDDVNIVIETGGANSWASTYGISSSKLERWHVEDRSLVKDASLTYASMGLTSTLQSFIEYGLNNYPAERTGVIFWNHGGAMRGVCYDEKKNDDSLLTNEVSSAIGGALSNCGMSNQKLEWVGYDACLMQVQDIASINSDYFNYMIASEESEAGYGWDYDTWVDDLYSKKTTPVILKAIVDGFITDNGGTSSSSNDQTLSYLDLSYMAAYITAWNNMATQLGNKITSSNKSNFNTLVKSAKYYADSDYTYYGIFDAKDFVNKLASNSTFNPGSTYTNAVLSAFNNLVAYSSCGRGAGNSYGLCMFWSVSSSCSKSTYYTSAMTKFTDWRTLVTTYGY